MTLDPTTKEAIAILRKAKRLMSRPGIGLAKGRLSKRIGNKQCYCAMGAMPTLGPCEFQRALDACEAEAGGDVAAWNDKPHRRKADVIRLYDRAILRLKEKSR